LFEAVYAVRLLAFGQIFFELVFFIGCVLVDHVEFTIVMGDDEAKVELA
jgi:hypothetical protein